MKKYQVMSLDEYNKPVDEDKVESVINSMAEQGWKLDQVCTGGVGGGGGGGESGLFMSWVYMVFERDY